MRAEQVDEFLKKMVDPVYAVITSMETYVVNIVVKIKAKIASHKTNIMEIYFIIKNYR